MEKGAKNKKDAKDEKQDRQIEEQVLKSLEVKDATPEDKLKLLLSKHVESERSNRRFRQDIKTYEKQLETVMREKENLQREYNKNVLMRDKLQEVCREQQKIIKSVKNESMAKIREEEERRKESQLKFQTSLNEITQSLSHNNEENMKLRDHNIEMTKKLKFLADQYHTREQQLEKLNEQVQLESELHQAKLSKIQIEAAMEKEILTKEKQIALEKLIQSQKVIAELTKQEQALKEQLNLYTTKYDEFQSSLAKSNDIFTTYKAELDRMSKTTKKLEKEAFEWKSKYERSNASLIGLATEKKNRDEHAVRCSKQVEQLQKLLRALQNERTHLYKVIRENNIECPPMPALPPEPEPFKTEPMETTADKKKMELMSKNCAELKQTLADLQNQMKCLNVKSADAEQQVKHVQQQQEGAAKKRQKKKTKAKGNKKDCSAYKESESESVIDANNLDNGVSIEQPVPKTLDADTAQSEPEESGQEKNHAEQLKQEEEQQVPEHMEETEKNQEGQDNNLEVEPQHQLNDEQKLPPATETVLSPAVTVDACIELSEATGST